MEAKNPATVAKILKEFLNKKFQGRSGGSYKISRDCLLQLTGRKYLEDSWLKELWEACLNEEVALTDLGEVYAVMESGVLMRYRSVPYKDCK